MSLVTEKASQAGHTKQKTDVLFSMASIKYWIQMRGEENFQENKMCEDSRYASNLENHVDYSRRLKN